MPNEGDLAPGFTLSDTGESVSLNDFLGKKVVLYFYPKDGTPGCTEEARELARGLRILKWELRLRTWDVGCWSLLDMKVSNVFAIARACDF